MKKTLSFALCLVMLVSSFTFLASSKEVIYYDIKTSAENGTIVLSVDKAEEGAIVFVEPVANDGYYYVEGSLKYGYDTGVAIGSDGAGNYCFTMPHDDITITATFKESPSVFEEAWNSLKKAGTPLLNVLKSLLPLLQGFFGNVVSVVKGLIDVLDIDLPF